MAEEPEKQVAFGWVGDEFSGARAAAGENTPLYPLVRLYSYRCPDRRAHRRGLDPIALK